MSQKLNFLFWPSCFSVDSSSSGFSFSPSHTITVFCNLFYKASLYVCMYTLTWQCAWATGSQALMSRASIWMSCGRHGQTFISITAAQVSFNSVIQDWNLIINHLRLQLGQVAHHVPAGRHQVLQMVLETLQLLKAAQGAGKYKEM